MDGMIVAALMVAGLALIPFAFGDRDPDEEDEGVTPEEPEPPEPPEEPDLGVTVFEEDGGIRIEVGEDETGSVVAIRTEVDIRSDPDDTGDSGTGTSFGVRFYLVPEGADFPPGVDEVLASLPEDQQALAVEGRDGFSIPLETYLANLGAEEIGRLDLGQVIRSDPYDPLYSSTLAVDTRQDSIPVTCNREMATYEIDVDNRWRADPLDGTVAGDPLVGIDADRLTVPDVFPTDCTVTFEDNVLSFTLDEDVDGQVIAILDTVEQVIQSSQSNTLYHIHFYVLPEGAPFPVSVNEMIENAPLNSALRDVSFEEDGSVRGTPYLELDEYMQGAGAAFLASVALGGIYELDLEGQIIDDRVNRDFTIEANRPYLAFRTAEHESGEGLIADYDTSTPDDEVRLFGIGAADDLIPPPPRA